MSSLKIGIIGGTRGMGRWFARFLRKSGYRVRVASRHTKVTLEELAAQSDIVIVGVPLSAMEPVIKRVGPLVKPEALLMDIASLKEKSVKTMLKHSKSAVIGCHPLFGPFTKSIRGQTVVLCPARPRKWLSWVKNLCKASGAKVQITTPHRHDELMGIIQVLRHFAAITLGKSLKKRGISWQEILKFSGPVHKIGFYSLGRILAQSPELYADIQMLNPSAKKVRREYIKAVYQLEKIVLKKDRKKFDNYFKDVADFSGEFKSKSLQETEYLIEKLVKRTIK